MNDLVIVDPIFRGSRMYFSSLAAKAGIEAGMNVRILARTEAKTDQFCEFFAGLEVEVDEVFRVPSEFWYGKIDETEQRRALARVRDVSSGDSRVYFPGLNEQWPEVTNVWREYGLHHLKALFVEYHPEFLLRAANSVWSSTLRGKWRQYNRYRLHRKAMLQHLSSFLGDCTNATVSVLDERVVNPRFSARPADISQQIVYLCDPAPERPKSTDTEPDRQQLQLLLVGSQSSRKGLREVVRLCNLYPNLIDKVRFTLVGRLTDETEPLRAQIDKNRAIITWIEDYVSEKEVAEHFNASDYVLLPYTREFNGSSGVLNSAVAHGRPVLATSHGLIGYRVVNEALGLCYNSGDVDGLAATIASLPRYQVRATKAGRQVRASTGPKFLSEHT